MDLVSPLAIVADARKRPSPPDPDLLPSRRLARDAIRAALGRGPVALTGEPGVGKSALWRSLEAGRSADESWVAVEAGPHTCPRDLYRLIARGLRVGSGTSGRVDLLDDLSGRSLDGERWTLVIDEAQNLDADALEEVRVLSNRLGEPDGFAAILLVGQSGLARRLRDRAGFALASRLSAHIHLRPLDADEVGTLLRSVAPDREWPEGLVDRVHLATGGRPGLVVGRADRAGAERETGPKPALPTAPARPEPAPAARAWDAPLVGPAKPPIRVEDGLIEVGWEPEPLPPADEPGGAEADADDREFLRDASPGDAAEERINDHYAALQAWHEWATNQGRHPEIAPAVGPPAEAGPASARPSRAESRSPLAASPKVWADEEHGFSPFGRLFAQAPQENEAD